MENDSNETDEKVSLMTLHAAKGLEFDTVFLPGWEEGLFPHQRSLDEEGLQGLEEERRLAYVGITRARRKAYITFAANRQIYNQWQNALPSRFVDELPAENVDVISETGLYGGGLSEPAVRSSHGEFQWNIGKRRLHKQTAPTIDGDSFTVSSSSSGSGFQEGERIFHQKFGYGRITSRDGNKLEVEFEKAGTKKVMDSFVEPV